MASRSTLGENQHTIPLFYACYLLRSIKTKSSRSTYVGSTPNPPRRIRQHNGELTQGAYKTRRGRPWVMTMIVHGFPSKLAALQFEWAWQHPYMSRHLRVSETRQGKETFSQIFKRDSRVNNLRTKILVARTMLPIPPYSTWPLHVKIFTEEAKRLWDEVQEIETNQPLPEGLTVSVEFEGVDGTTAVPTSARAGPIDVKDTDFNLSHIYKYQSLVNKGTQMPCSVCRSEINVKHMDHLRVALCPQGSCLAVSHLDCLARLFSEHPSNPPGLIPRGGICEACDHYTLWGDVIRGCYRRARGGLQQPASEQESEGDSDNDNEENVPLGDELSSHPENQIGGSPRKPTRTPTVRIPTSRKGISAPVPRAAKRGAQKGRPVDSDVEDFAAEMDAIDCDTEDSEQNLPPRKEHNGTTSRRQAPKPIEAKRTRIDHDEPRDMDEIVRQAFGNMSTTSPNEPHASHSIKPSRAEPPTVAGKPQKHTKAKNRVEVFDKERPGRVIDLEGGTAPKPRKRRTPSPEYIDLEGI
ncbi:unnamed protein product [Rhizoctonia solani]|uniref:GIY-YIG domain-containing protein n=1 Tax=Rhizoctonia solani TaxID=456999 RepID=A0A8H3DTI2_9AGAM|nr:unnamed protein product [Rhizoctonia solani]